MTFPVRLDDHLSSATPAGTAFTATVIAPLTIDGRVVLPERSIVHGTVKRALTVGMGVVRERSIMDLEFQDCELPDGSRYPLTLQLQSIDNSREAVDAKGQINGVLSADSPQKFLWGIWYRPSTTLMNHSALGLTGAQGMIWAKYALGPMGAAGLMAGRYLMFSLPDPEIDLPPGTEMYLRATEVPDGPLPAAVLEHNVDESWAARLRDLPAQVKRPDGKAGPDIINIAFIGQGYDLHNAFEAAGWVGADALTRQNFARFARAFTIMGSYPTAPVSPLVYQGHEPEFVFQKSFNTIAQRHHIRVWRSSPDPQGPEIWLGAATHDTGISLNAVSTVLNHIVDPHVDLERNKVLQDLEFAGCVDDVSYLDRPSIAHGASRDSYYVSDGRMTVVWLRPCTAEPLEAFTATPAKPAASRVIRRVVLETRQYLLRDNIYWTVRTLFKHRTKDETAQAKETIASPHKTGLSALLFR